jgi:hypothetical protein
MKTTNNASSSRTAISSLLNVKRIARGACVAASMGGLLAFSASPAMGAWGSVRGEERHEEVRHEDVRHEEVHREPVKVVHAPAPVAQHWDDHDLDARHLGGFIAGVAHQVLRGTRVRVLPARYSPVVYSGRQYFVDDSGAYYVVQPDGQYLIVQPPVGVVVSALPAGVVPIVYGPTTYYYLDGTYYVPQPGGFAVVNPPPGVVVPALPTGAAQVIINGVVVYQFNGFNYTPSFQNGMTVYTVTPA